MDHRSEVRDFLTTRRARLSPEQAGLPTFRTTRRVQGLRREEVASLAGVSVDYYNRMERGSLAGVSESVLDALAGALRLDESERAHLHDLARAAGSTRRPTTTVARTRVRPDVRQILDALTVPAYLRTGWFDVLAVNRLGAALLPELNPSGAAASSAPPNLARYLFLDPGAQEFYAAWDAVARDCVATLRIEAGRDPANRRLTDLVGELTTRSEAFATWWATHDVRLHHRATKLMHHPTVGDLELTGQALTLPGDPGLTMIVYTVEPASPSSEALALLGSWTAPGAPGAVAEPVAGPSEQG